MPDYEANSARHGPLDERHVTGTARDGGAYHHEVGAKLSSEVSIAGRFCRDVAILSQQMKQLCDSVRELSRLQALQNTKLDAAMKAASR